MLTGMPFQTDMSLVFRMVAVVSDKLIAIGKSEKEKRI